MFRIRSLVVAFTAMAVIVSCGSESSSSQSVATTDGTVTLPGVTNEVVPGQAPELPRAQTVQLAQPAVWPASDVVFDTPEEAAASFVSNVLGVEPVLGDYQGGDSRSGEIQVFSPGEAGGSEDLSERGLLGLRIIAPNDGWFVIAASSEGQEFTSPQALDLVPAAPLTVTGRGRGFEGTIVVTAFIAGDADRVLDQQITAGGAFADLEPWSVTLDLSDASPGDTVALLARGDTGLEGDPGDFTSIPIVISDVLPPTS